VGLVQGKHIAQLGCFDPVHLLLHLQVLCMLGLLALQHAPAIEQCLLCCKQL
jgi:hypothetical protein